MVVGSAGSLGRAPSDNLAASYPTPSHAIPMEQPPNEPRRFRHKAGVIETALHDELILLDPTTQRMFSLNGSGLVAWKRLDDGTLDDAVSAIVAEFDVSRADAERDVRALLAALLEGGLLVAGAPAA